MKGLARRIAVLEGRQTGVGSQPELILITSYEESEDEITGICGPSGKVVAGLPGEAMAALTARAQEVLAEDGSNGAILAFCIHAEEPAGVDDG